MCRAYFVVCNAKCKLARRLFAVVIVEQGRFLICVDCESVELRLDDC